MAMMEKIEAFLAHKDTDGISNREKIQANQRIIRRTEETDRTKSYEDSAPSEGIGGLPEGIVLKDGELMGFGIQIFNEGIYPLKTFEIYFRGCGLTGPLDLSGNPGLLYVDLYHNAIESVSLEGDGALRILGLQDNCIDRLDIGDLSSCQGIDLGKNRLAELDVSRNTELVELYVNDNRLTRIDLSNNVKLKYFYCHNNRMTDLDTTNNPDLRHLDATGNPMKRILSLAPQREGRLPLELRAGAGGGVGLKYNPVYDAQWKETGEWQQTYFAYPDDGKAFAGWYDSSGACVSDQAVWQDEYGESRILTARFE